MGLGRLGNFIEVRIAGSVTDVWRAVKLPDIDGFRQPVVLYDGLKNLPLIPVLLAVRSRRQPRAMVLGVCLIGCGGLRTLIDLFREYRVELLGLPLARS